MRSYFLSLFFTAGLVVFPSLGLESAQDEFCFELRPDKGDPTLATLWLWPPGHREQAVPQKWGEGAQFSPVDLLKELMDAKSKTH